MVYVITAWGVWWTGLPHSPKTDSDRLMKDNRVPILSVDLWNGKGKERKVALPGIEPRASGLSRQRSATKLRHPPTTNPLSLPFIALLLSDCWGMYWMIAVCNCWEECLSMGVVAQWQSAGSSSQRPWVRSPTAPPFFLPFDVSKVYGQ